MVKPPTPTVAGHGLWSVRIHGARDLQTWAKIFGGAAAALLVTLLAAVLMPRPILETWVIPGVLLSALLGLISMELGARANQREVWQKSIESFRDQFGMVAAFLSTAADMQIEWHLKHDLPTKWNEIANLINWPRGMGDRPLSEWRAHAGQLDRAEAASHRIAYLSYTAWPGHVEFGNARRNVTRIIGDWVGWSRGPYGREFRVFIAPHIKEYRNPLVMLAYLEIVLAESNPLNNAVPVGWVDLGALWPEVLGNRPPVAEHSASTAGG